MSSNKTPKASAWPPLKLSIPDPNPAPTAKKVEFGNGLELGDRLYNVHAVLRAVIHQLHEVEVGSVKDASTEVHDAGRAVRLAAAAVYQVAVLLSDCEVSAEHEDTQAELNALHVRPKGGIE
jgi:hypothetical protein